MSTSSGEKTEPTLDRACSFQAFFACTSQALGSAQEEVASLVPPDVLGSRFRLSNSKKTVAHSMVLIIDFKVPQNANHFKSCYTPVGFGSSLLLSLRISRGQLQFG